MRFTETCSYICRERILVPRKCAAVICGVALAFAGGTPGLAATDMPSAADAAAQAASTPVPSPPDRDGRRTLNPYQTRTARGCEGDARVDATSSGPAESEGCAGGRLVRVAEAGGNRTHRPRG